MMKAYQISIEEALEMIKSEEYSIEYKVDGSREHYVRGDLISCRNVNHNTRYRHIYEALKNALGNDDEIDGEVSLPIEMKSNVLELNKKCNWDKVIFYVFDCVKYDGLDLRSKPLFERQGILRHIVGMVNSPYVVFIQQFGTLREGWDFVIKNDLEGLVVKKLDSRYETALGKEYRSHSWLKIKNWKEGLDEIVGHNIGDTQKGSFRLSVGTNINCPDLETLREYTEALREQKRIFAEFYYRFKTHTVHFVNGQSTTKNGFYTPILKRLVVVDTPFQLFRLLKEQVSMGMISKEEFDKRIEIEHTNV